ncbi:SPFH domain-containing protein [Streptomyces sp. MS1.HAVA.3]|uniref:SPFH domain-containing protein n=1 Tax=Streptomyces caledonius TaxID=3134107 RepID=A0ABU8U8G3_9ACTN
MAQEPESASAVRPAQAPPRSPAQEPQQPVRQAQASPRAAAQQAEVAAPTAPSARASEPAAPTVRPGQASPWAAVQQAEVPAPTARSARASEPAAPTVRPGQASPWAAVQQAEVPASTVRPTQSSPWSATPVREFDAQTGRPTQESEPAQQPVRPAHASPRAAVQQAEVPASAAHSTPAPEPSVSAVRPAAASPWAAARQAEAPAPTIRPTQAASQTAEPAAPVVRPAQASSRAAVHEVEGVAPAVRPAQVPARAVVPEPAAEYRQPQAEVPAARSQCEAEPAYASAGHGTHGTYDMGGQGSDPQGTAGLDIPHPQDEAARAGVATLRLRSGAPEVAAAHPQHSRPESAHEPEATLDAEPEPDPQAAPEPAAGTEPKAQPVPVLAAGTVPEPARGAQAVPVPAAGTQPEVKAGAMAEPLPGAGAQAVPVPEAGTVPAAGTRPERQPGAQAEPVPGTQATPVAAGSGVPGPGVVEIVAQAVARGLDKPAEGHLQDTPRLGRPRGAAVTEVPVHLPFRGEPRRMPTATAGPAAGGRAPRPAPAAASPRRRPAPRAPRPGAARLGRRGRRRDRPRRLHGRALAGRGRPAPFLAAFGAAPRAYQGLRATHWPPLAFLGIVALVALGGLGRARTGHAWVLTLFGRYRGTVRRTGLTWVSPLLLRRRVDVRLRHWRSDPMPAVDSGGLALQVVVQVVWQVKDTARATLAVADHTEYLAEQVESAMARVLSQLPADAFHEDAPTLRDAEAVGDALTRMLAAETEAVGIEVFSAQPTRIEYAAEVAEAMRRRRVAAIDAKHRDSVLSSVVDAVDDTVHRLTSRGLVELDDYERKALVKDLTVAFYTGRPE